MKQITRQSSISRKDSSRMLRNLYDPKPGVPTLVTTDEQTTFQHKQVLSVKFE